MRHLTNGNVIVSLPEDLRFERYLRDSFPGLVARLRGGFSERIAPEEVVQEALLRAWQLSAHGEEIRSLEPWMTVAAKNLADLSIREILTGWPSARGPSSAPCTTLAPSCAGWWGKTRSHMSTGGRP
jgi:hypothetical protein